MTANALAIGFGLAVIWWVSCRCVCSPMCVRRQAAQGEVHWSFAIDATDVSFSKYMTVAIDLPSRGVFFWAAPLDTAVLDAPASDFSCLCEGELWPPFAATSQHRARE